MNRLYDITPSPAPSLAERLTHDNLLVTAAFAALVYGAFRLGVALLLGTVQPVLVLPAVLGALYLVVIEALDSRLNGDSAIFRCTLAVLALTAVFAAVAAGSFYVSGGHHVLRTLGIA